MIILAGDIGGTKSNLGLFERGPDGRPKLIAEESFSTHDFKSPAAMLARFLNGKAKPVDLVGCCLGLAGPVEDGVVVAEWLPWKRVTEQEVAEESGIRGVWFINDMVATAYGVTVLQGDQLVTLNQGVTRSRPHNVAVIAAGTGLGESALIVDRQGRYHPMPSEGGHTNFAPRTDVEFGLFRWLDAHLHPVNQEAVICGRGLVNVYTYLKWQRTDPTAPPPPLPTSSEQAGAISKAAADRSDPVAVEALDVFVSAYGARAGSLSMQVMASGGCYIGGGIAPKNLPKLLDGTFMKAFSDKGHVFGPICEKIPVYVVMEQKTALLGAAQYGMLEAKVA
jgi:glucokinase